ncbi:hypothetical protein HNR26_002393 [Rhizobium rosettiformans]|uniref:PepSY domain-containing protein n=2 Tax=Rhizobium rosettiformans TaxID=1368430 RepID=A0A4S8PWN1_9HYPH|nr:hypothetical protein [Rhizobium rosettiformans]MBB5276324.1 hypothetical protein [Rhizobium rosettiformans]THV36053.1 hypothetical protein FAA86_12045 [Rhizobium rosettiformans W3]
MKYVATALALGLFAAPAHAQSSTDAQDSSSTDTTTTTSSQSGQPSAVTQQKLQSQLEGAGFSNVQILDASYLVQAQTEEGNTVLMVIDPPMRGSGMSGQSGSGTSGSSSSESGSTESTTP